MKEIKLSQGQIALVDDEDYDFLMQWHWHAVKPKNIYYALTNIWINGKRTSKRMHTLLVSVPEGMVIDHKDRNGLNNQRSNLRVCTLSQNSANSRPAGKSKYLGVSYLIQNNHSYIQAQICKDHKVIHIGMFSTEEEAARAYDAKAKEIHGEFANLNFK
jgi:hypothetical protein